MPKLFTREVSILEFVVGVIVIIATAGASWGTINSRVGTLEDWKAEMKTAQIRSEKNNDWRDQLLIQMATKLGVDIPQRTP